LTTPALTPVMTLRVRVSPPLTIDGAEGRGRRFIPIVGGEVSGAYEGEVLPGGGDWQTLWDDGRMDLEAHYVLSLGGRLVEVLSQGVRQGPPDVLAALARGEEVDPSLYYFRTAVRLRSAAPELCTLNARLFVSTGARMKDHVRLEIFEVA
jgi:hypothetical protein